MFVLLIDKEAIPQSMLLTIEGTQYEFVFSYDVTFDFFTIDLLQDGSRIITGEKLLIDKPLFTTLISPFEHTRFIPMDLSNQIERITFDNFGVDVFIYVFTIVEGVIVGE